jgi:hypothetical protein
MTTAPMTTSRAPARSASRVAAAASVLFAVSLFGMAASLNIPPDGSGLLAWWQEPANRFAGTISSFFAVVAAVLLAVVVNHVRHLPAASGTPAWLAFARAMGAAFTATLLVSAATRGVIDHLVGRLDYPLPPLDVLRYSTGLNYALLDRPVMAVLALTIAAISIVTLRTAALARWTAYVGLAGAVVILGAVAAQMGAYAIPAALLWAVCLSVALWRS